MTGTPSQIELAGQLRLRVSDEFDRVARAFLEVARRQNGPDLADTELVLTILEEERARVMAQDHAGYFIREWQELAGQVREGIARDSRFDGILERRKSRRAPPEGIGIDAV